MDWFDVVCIFVLVGISICWLGANFAMLGIQKKKRELLDDETKKSDKI